MSPRTGRPIKGKTKRTNKLTVMLNDDEKALLDECTERLSLQKTEVVVKGIQLVKLELDIKKD